MKREPFCMLRGDASVHEAVKALIANVRRIEATDPRFANAVRRRTGGRLPR